MAQTGQGPKSLQLLRPWLVGSESHEVPRFDRYKNCNSWCGPCRWRYSDPRGGWELRRK